MLSAAKASRYQLRKLRFSVDHSITWKDVRVVEKVRKKYVVYISLTKSMVTFFLSLALDFFRSSGVDLRAEVQWNLLFVTDSFQYENILLHLYKIETCTIKVML